jgi:DDE superfamily endonuclease
MQGNRLWPLWLDLLLCFRGAFMPRGFRHFVQWTTGFVLTTADHTLTQALTSSQREPDWQALEKFVERGHWNQPGLEGALLDALRPAPEHLFHGYALLSGDDTKVHRNSPGVWGTCTYHEYSARCPNRATTVRAHNWVVTGLLRPRADHSFWFLPALARLYFRQTQLPCAPDREVFQTKDQLLLAQLRQHAQALAGPCLATFDGGFAHRGLVRGLVLPEAGQPRLDFLTRLRCDACLYERPPAQRPPGRRGPARKWGAALPKPQEAAKWPGPWHAGQVYAYGRRRRLSFKRVVCLWRVAGHATPVQVVLARLEGFTNLFTLVCSALDLSAGAVVEAFAAHYQQENGFRDLKQQVGWEEGRYWTKEPVRRTTQVVLLCQSLLRLLQERVEAEAGDTWWVAPPWYPHKRRASVQDLLGYFRQHGEEISGLLSAWLGSG